MKTVCSIVKIIETVMKVIVAVFATVIDDIVTLTQVLAMGDYHAFVKHIVEILCYPLHLVVTSCGILPRGSGENEEFVVFLQFMHCVNGSWHGIHQAEESWNLINSSFIFLLHLLAYSVQS